MAHLTLEQRYKIQSYSQAGFKNSEIAEKIGVHKSTVGREKKRNCDLRNGGYKAELAEKKASTRKKLKPKTIHFTSEIRQRVDSFLDKEYSPEQIKGYCDKNDMPCVSHERIYQYVWKDKRAGGTLYKHLRRKGRKYQKRGSSKKSRGVIPNRIGIEHRPDEIEDRKRFGDLEVDLIIGKNHKQAMVTINDRASGMLKMGKIKSKQAHIVALKIKELLADWKPFVKTMTSDNGKEFSMHQEVAKDLMIDFYFARPYHSWERGSNENLNGLIRQYFPKKSCFESITDEQIIEVQNKLNTRPRKRFNYENPIFVMNQLLFNQKLRL